ncbi:MAG: hypothetical protein HDT42_06680 [Ruminococcaceae bacterium]|nr:hypothetical protein [Oscillospiraceae bacterium]
MPLIILLVIMGVLFVGAIVINLGIALIKGTVANIVAADAIIVTGLMIFLIHGNGVHIVFSILLGLVVGACFVALTKIPVFGKIFVVICGLGWAFGLYQLIDDFGIFYKLNNDPIYTEDPHVLSELFESDPIWWWTIVIIMVLVFVGLHLKCVIKSADLDDADLTGVQQDIQPPTRAVSREELLSMSTEKLMQHAGITNSTQPAAAKHSDTQTTETKERKEFEIYTPTNEEIANSVPYNPNRK